LICFEQPSPDDRAEVSRPGREPTYPGRNPVRHVTDVPAMALEQLLDANAVGRERVIATAAKAETQVVRGGRIFPDRGGRGGPSWSAEEPCRDDCGLRATPKAKKASTPKRPLFGRGTVLKTVPGGTPMIDPSSKLGRELKAAEDFFELARGGVRFYS
jgi:hypothetical protein